MILMILMWGCLLIKETMEQITKHSKIWGSNDKTTIRNDRSGECGKWHTHIIEDLRSRITQAQENIEGN